MANASTPKYKLAVIRHANRVYDALYEESKPEEIDGNELQVFRGSYTKVFDSLLISKSYYGPIRRLLEESGAIVYMRPTSGTTPSIIALVHRITDEDVARFSREDLTKRDGDATMRVLAEIQDEVIRLKAWRDSTGGLNIAEALRNIETRLANLESLVNGNSGKSQGRTRRENATS